jgi:hypothetical protein
MLITVPSLTSRGDLIRKVSSSAAAKNITSQLMRILLKFIWYFSLMVRHRLSSGNFIIPIASTPPRLMEAKNSPVK